MPRALQALPRPARRRGIGMIRVSKEREGMTSPENQRYLIEQFAERENIDIVEWVEGIDESGSRKNSAWWNRLSYGCEQIEKHDADVLVLWRVDRVARNRLRWAVAEERIATVGGRILSATEPNDESPAGNFGRSLLVDHAVFMAESIGATWKETLERRVRHGYTPNGQRHFGYTYSRETKTYSIDPVEGPALAGMYRSYIAGESAQSIAERHTDPAAKPGPSGAYARYARWNTPAVLRLLDSGFGAGYVLFRGTLADGAHEPVITPDEWVLFTHAREARRRRPRAERSPYTYSGMLHCHCGSKMSGRTDHGVRRYSCVQSAHYGRHEDASLAEHVIDAAMLDWLEEIRERLNAAARTAPRPMRVVEDPARDVGRKLAGVTERLDAATIKYVDGDIPKDAYERLRDRLETDREKLEAELSRHNAQATVHPLPFVGDLLTLWPEMRIERRREALRLLVDRIDIQTRDAAERVVITSALTRT